MNRRLLRASLALLALVAASATARGEEPSRFALGLRPVLLLADGDPANDIPGGGVWGRWRVGERWAFSAAVELAKFDFEEPARLLGLAQSEAEDAIDSKAESVRGSVWAERGFGAPEGRSRWYLGAGLGVASVDVPDAAGPLEGGGSFAIVTEADPEIILGAVAGWERQLGRRWVLDAAIRLEQHFADWQVVDTVSGRTGAVDDYLTWGAHLGIGWRF